MPSVPALPFAPLKVKVRPGRVVTYAGLALAAVALVGYVAMRVRGRNREQP